MTAKKKLIISLSIIALIFVSLVSTIVIVFASTEQTVISNVNMNYTAVDIDGKVSATYTLGSSGTPVSLVLADLTAESGTVYKDENGFAQTEIVFKAEDEATSTETPNYGSLILPDADGDGKADIVTIAPEDREVLLTFTFKNTGDTDYTARMDFNTTPTTTNMIVEYATNTLNYSSVRKALVVENDETATYYIKISVDDVGADASFECNLTWLLEKYEALEGEEDFEIGDVESTENSDGTYSVSYNGSPLQNGTLFIPSSIGTAEVTSVVASTDTSIDTSQVTNIVIADGVTTIGANAFRNYTNLTEVTIPESVTIIDLQAFQYCSSLETINFSEDGNLKTIGSNAFDESKITELTIPASIENINAQAFARCSSLTTVNFSENSNLKVLGDHVFYQCKNLTSITLPEGLETIGALTFYNTKISEITIPSTVTSIGRGFCSNHLNAIYLADGAEEHYSAYFLENYKCLVEIATKRLIIGLNNCSLAGFNLDDNADGTISEDEIDITKIDDYAIMGRGLTEVIVPEGVTYIGNYTFNGNTTTTVSLPTTLTTIMGDCFYNARITSINIPANVSTLSNAAFVNCSLLESITVDDANTVYYVVDNCVINRNTKTLVLGCKNSVIPTDGSVTSIANYAFSGHAGLTDVTISSYITKVGAYAFRNCTSINITFENTENWYISSVHSYTMEGAELYKANMTLVDSTLFETMNELISDASTNYCKYSWYYLP